MASFNRYSDWIFNNPHTREDELEWLKQQGPWSPGLIDYLERHQHQYDVIVFKPLQRSDLENIVEIELRKVTKRLTEHGLKIELAQEAGGALAWQAFSGRRATAA